MKSREGKSQREEKSRREKMTRQKRKSQKKEDADARKGRKVAKHCVFPMIWGSGESKSRLAKAAGAEPCGQMSDGKVHAVVARSTFPSQNVQSTPCSDHFEKLRCRTSARRCGAKHISKSKWTKHLSSGPLLEVAMSKKCTPLWCEAHFEVKTYKAHHARTTFGSWDVEKVHAVVARSTFRSQNVQNIACSRHFWRFRCRFAWQAQGMGHLLKVSKTWGFCVIAKNDGRRGTFEEDLQRCIFRGRRSTRDIFIGAVRRSGRWFPERGCILEHRIFRFAEMSLRDRCSTSYDLASLFRGRRSTFDRWTGKIAKRIVRGRQLCTQLSIFEGSLAELLGFWCCQVQKLKKSGRIASFWMLSASKHEEVSQNCFVFDVVTCKHWGSLGELLRVWCCQRWKMRKSRRIAAFLML